MGISQGHGCSVSVNIEDSIELQISIQLVKFLVHDNSCGELVIYRLELLLDEPFVLLARIRNLLGII